MSILLTADDTNGTGVDPFYDEYIDFDFFQQRANWIVQKFPSVVHICIAGAAFGYLMIKLMAAGKNVSGIDLSSFARNRHGTLSGANLARYVLDDITRESAYTQAKTIHGLRRNQTINLVVTEDVLPCAQSDSEALVIATTARSQGANVLHIISCSNPGDVLATRETSVLMPPGAVRRSPRLLWHTMAAWRQLIGNDGSIILNAETWQTDPVGF